MTKRFRTVRLGKNQKEFLRTYCPEDRMFTSEEEMIKIANVLKLIGKDYLQLSRLRNAVVQFYSEKEVFCIPAMQSVTAVIDVYKLRAGGPV
jgi:hypothetical protein